MGYNNVSNVIIDKIYPVVKATLDKNTNKFKAVLADFINDHSGQMYDIAPYDIIYYRQSDIDKIFKSLELDPNDIEYMMHDCFFWDIPYKPLAAKEPYVIVCMMAIRYYLINKKEKDAELVAIYLEFTGKFYASIFSRLFPKVAPSKYKTVMDYVINNMLSDKYDIRTKGSLFGAVQSLVKTWIDTYGTTLTKKADDDAIGILIQQLRDREKSMIGNIAKLYYQAYENKNYLNYETDNLSDGKEFRITDNDSLRATRYTESTIQYLTTNSISLKICNQCKDQNIKATEIKDIMETIVSDRSNLDDLYRVVNILICDFIRNFPSKTVGSVDFIVNSIKMKPNTKDAYIIELKDIITRWLDVNSASYRKRKNRKATAISYYKAILMYITLVISAAAK